MSNPWNRRPEFTPIDELPPLYPISLGGKNKSIKPQHLLHWPTVIIVGGLFLLGLAIAWEVRGC